MTPRTLKLNAHRSLTYYTPEDVATLQHELSIARQNAELLTGYWKAAVAEVKALRQQHLLPDHYSSLREREPT